MFKQIKSAIFWTLVYKFRKRLVIVGLLISTVLLSQWIYSDIVEYLELTQQTQYLNYILPIKWIVIFFNIAISIYLIATIFKPETNKKVSKEEKKPKKEDIQKVNSNELSQREKSFLNKKLRSKADILMDK